VVAEAIHSSKRFHWSVVVGAVAFALCALVLAGPIVVAVVMLRCCSDAHGPTPAAWLTLLGILAVVTVVAASVGGLVGAALRRLVISAAGRATPARPRGRRS
jgi:NADH:ubiquinone oxidoreductase subunit 2 (subunit N)